MDTDRDLDVDVDMGSSRDILLGDILLQGDILLRRRFVKETFCSETFYRGDVLYVRHIHLQ